MMTMKKKKNTAEFFPHRDNRPRKQNPSKKTKQNKTRQKNKKTKVRAVPGNCPDGQTDRHTCRINI
jgi:hypothetical protein